VQVTFQAKALQSIEAFVEFVERTRAQLGRRTGVAPVSNLKTFPQNGDRRDACPASLQSWAEYFLDETGYFAELQRVEKNRENAEARVRNLRELTATLDNFGRPGDPASDRLQSFLEDITLDSELEEEKETGDAVTLITMHSCKGWNFRASISWAWRKA